MPIALATLHSADWHFDQGHGVGRDSVSLVQDSARRRDELRVYVVRAMSGRRIRVVLRSEFSLQRGGQLAFD